MKLSKATATAALIVLALAVLLPVIGTWVRRIPQSRCALDGAEIEPSYRVRIDDAEGRTHLFCCIRCCEMWLAQQAALPRRIWVTDESSGEEIDARLAVFVRSVVVTSPTTGDRIHAFKDRLQAERHAKSCWGAVLSDKDKPFASYSASSSGSKVFPRPIVGE